MRFEEHDNQLFRMLEEPVPLTPDAKLPCLVRLIQDDSRMGMFNRDTKPSRLSDFYLAARIVNNNIIVDEFMESDYHRFEIIGYPVEDGSAEWALYQMMQGKKVTKRHLISHIYWHYDASPHLKCISEYNCGTLQIMVVPEIWLTTADPTGWQIYKEPKPKLLLADAQVGDLCKHRNGDWSQIIDTNGTYIQGQPIRTTLKDSNGINRNFCLSGSHFTMQFGGEYDIIHTEPLATEGTVEWAGQMLKLGKMVKHENNIYPHSLDVNGKVYYCHEHRESQGLLQEWIIGRGAKTGWQIYEEPKIEPPKEPDYVICKRCGGSKSIANPAVSNTSYTTCPKCGGTGYEIKPEPAKEQFEVGDCRIEFVKQELHNLLDKL